MIVRRAQDHIQLVTQPEIRDAAFPSDEALREALHTARARTLQGEAGPRP